MKIKVQSIQKEGHVGSSMASSHAIIQWVKAQPERVEAELDHSPVRCVPMILVDKVRVKDFETDNAAVKWAERNNMTVINKK